MTLLEIVFLISGIIILIVSADFARKDRFTAFQCFIFLAIGIGLIVFTFFPGILVWIGGIFGLERGADALVYLSIVFLIYSILFLLYRTETNREEMSRLVRKLALDNAHNNTNNNAKTPKK